MRRLKQLAQTSVLICLCMVAQAVAAQSWIQLQKVAGDSSNALNNQAVDVLYSPAIDRKGDLATVSLLNNVFPYKEGASAIVDVEFNCVDSVFRFKRLTVYPSANAKGRPETIPQREIASVDNLPAVDDDPDLDMAESVSGAHFGALKRIACDGGTPTDYLKEATGIAVPTAPNTTNLPIRPNVEYSGQATWVKLGANPRTGTLFYDTQIFKKDDTLIVKLLVNPLQVDAKDRESAFVALDGKLAGQSLVQSFELNCTDKTWRRGWVAVYSQPNAQGPMIDTELMQVQNAQPYQDAFEKAEGAFAWAGINGRPFMEINSGRLLNIVCFRAPPSTYATPSAMADLPPDTRSTGGKSMSRSSTEQTVKGANVVSVVYGTGRIDYAGEENGKRMWLETWSNGTKYRLREDSFDEWSVNLFDAERSANVQLDMYRKVMVYDDGLIPKIDPYPLESYKAGVR